MAYDAELAERIRGELAHLPDVAERKMFGGLAFLIGGNMTVVARGKGGLMIRADPSTTEDLVGTTPAAFAEMRGRQMKGWLHLDAADVGSDVELAAWINRAIAFSSTLPKKS
jgi:TfoX/Sxy family transcriptional regulator of competence genes